MIEAVNMSLSTSSMNRVVAAQTAAAANAPDPAAPVKLNVGVSAPYLSPHVNLVGFRKPIFIIRDSETGAHIRQFPSENQIKAYQRAQEVGEQLARRSANTETVDAAQYKAAQQQALVAESSVQFKQARTEVQVQVAQQQSAPAPAQLKQPASTGSTGSKGSSSSSSEGSSTFSTEA